MENKIITYSFLALEIRGKEQRITTMYYAISDLLKYREQFTSYSLDREIVLEEYDFTKIMNAIESLNYTEATQFNYYVKDCEEIVISLFEYKAPILLHTRTPALQGMSYIKEYVVSQYEHFKTQIDIFEKAKCVYQRTIKFL
jgi:hypothetical protein